MGVEKKIHNCLIRVVKSDITDAEVESFVFYARPDLALGSGFGTAIAVRGGPAVQEELKKLGPQVVGDAVVTGAGNMKAKYIIHAVGPRFQESDIEAKLRTTVTSCLKRAEEKKIKQVAFPAMGVGFYGVPLDVSAKVMFDAIQVHLASSKGIGEIDIYLRDTREVKPFESRLQALA